MPFIDTHSHIYGEEFAADLDAVVQRAKNAGAEKLFLPNENAGTLDAVLDVCDKYPGFCFPMIGLHPEEIKENYSGGLDNMERRLQVPNPFIAVGEMRFPSSDGMGGEIFVTAHDSFARLHRRFARGA